MKDPSHPGAGTYSLALRIQFEPTSPLSEVPISITESSAAERSAAETTMQANYKFTRWPSEGFGALSSLSTTATVLLFTPVLIPASVENISREKDTIDPFEAFGRALCLYHKRIRHVPYVPKTGYTETHAAFLSQADAIITVICEPEWDKDQSVLRQMDFAKASLDAVEGKEANVSNTLVLVQCGSEKHRTLANASFKHVIEVSSYDDEVAKHLAQAIFKSKR